MDDVRKELEAAREELLNDIMEWGGTVTPVEPDEVTVSQYAKRAGCRPQAAKRILDRGVAEGRLTVRIARGEGGKRSSAYKKATTVEEE